MQALAINATNTKTSVCVFDWRCGWNECRLHPQLVAGRLVESREVKSDRLLESSAVFNLASSEPSAGTVLGIWPTETGKGGASRPTETIRPSADVVPMQPMKQYPVYARAFVLGLVTLQVCGLALGYLGEMVVSPHWSHGFFVAAVAMGYLYTFIPTLLYAALLPVVVASISNRRKAPVLTYVGSSGLTLITVSIVVTLLSAWRDVDDEMVMMTIVSVLTGWMGTWVVTRVYSAGNQAQQSTAPLPSAPQTGPSEGAR